MIELLSLNMMKQLCEYDQSVWILMMMFCCEEQGLFLVATAAIEVKMYVCPS